MPPRSLMRITPAPSSSPARTTRVTFLRLARNCSSDGANCSAGLDLDGEVGAVAGELRSAWVGHERTFSQAIAPHTAATHTKPLTIRRELMWLIQASRAQGGQSRSI